MMFANLAAILDHSSQVANCFFFLFFISDRYFFFYKNLRNCTTNRPICRLMLLIDVTFVIMQAGKKVIIIMLFWGFYINLIIYFFA